jgi:hypothetical protein
MVRCDDGVHSQHTDQPPELFSSPITGRAAPAIANAEHTCDDKSEPNLFGTDTRKASLSFFALCIHASPKATRPLISNVALIFCSTFWGVVCCCDMRQE